MVPGAAALLDKGQVPGREEAAAEALLDVVPVGLLPLVGAEVSPESPGRLDHAALTRLGGAAQDQVIRPDDLHGHELCEERGPALVKMEPQGDFPPHCAVKLQVLLEGGQDGLLHGVPLQIAGEGKGL